MIHVVAPAIGPIIASARQSVTPGAEVFSAGNLVGTILYFPWFNLGLIALIFPGRADPLVLRLDWPYLIGG